MNGTGKTRERGEKAVASETLMKGESVCTYVWICIHTRVLASTSRARLVAEL